MTKYVPSSFDRATVRAGLLKAMGFGEPTQTADKVTFFFPKRSTTSAPHDQDGIPFDPNVRLSDAGAPSKTVACAVEFMDWNGAVVEPGTIKATRLRITLLQEEWNAVKDFTYVTAGDNKYLRDYVEPPLALGSIDVYQVMVRAEDER